MSHRISKTDTMYITTSPSSRTCKSEFIIRLVIRLAFLLSMFFCVHRMAVADQINWPGCGTITYTPAQPTKAYSFTSSSYVSEPSGVPIAPQTITISRSGACTFDFVGALPGGTTDVTNNPDPQSSVWVSNVLLSATMDNGAAIPEVGTPAIDGKGSVIYAPTGPWTITTSLYLTRNVHASDFLSRKLNGSFELRPHNGGQNIVFSTYYDVTIVHSCEVTTPNTAISWGSIPISDFKGQGESIRPMIIDLHFNCGGATNINGYFSPVAPSTVNGDVIEATTEKNGVNVPTGIGIRIRGLNDSPVSFDPSHPTLWGVMRIYGDDVNNSLPDKSVAFKATLVQTSSQPPRTGNFTATVNWVVTYL